METWTTPASTIEGYATYFRSIQQAGGDAQLRQTLSAHRDVARSDRQMSQAQKDSLLQIYDRVETELLPAPSSTP